MAVWISEIVPRNTAKKGWPPFDDRFIGYAVWQRNLNSEGLLTLSDPVGNQREADNAEEHHVQLFEPIENATLTLQSPEQPFHFVAPLVQLTIVLPWLDPVSFRRDHRKEPQIQRGLAYLTALVGTIHEQMDGRAGTSQVFKQGTSCARLGERENAMAVRASAATI